MREIQCKPDEYSGYVPKDIKDGILGKALERLKQGSPGEKKITIISTPRL